MEKITESESPHRHLEKMDTLRLLNLINEEDKTVAHAVSKVLPVLEVLVKAVVDKILAGGRLFYIGAGTSGRLGVLDASECPPTFGVPPDLITGIIAGGIDAMKSAIEFAEDNHELGWKDLQEYSVSDKDIVIGLSASGSTPYVVHCLETCKKNGILTASISCNPASEVSRFADHPVEIIVGPEVITGSTRMKSGTAQKMTLNMISTAVMVALGRVEDNKMVHMQLSNKKLVERGIRMVMKATGISHNEARARLEKFGSVKKAIENDRL